MNETTLIWMLIIPSIAGLLAYLWPRQGQPVVRLLALVATAMLVFLAIIPIYHSDWQWQWTWLRTGQLAIGIDLTARPFASVISLMIALFGFLITLYDVAYLRGAIGRHYAYMLWTLAGAIGAALANDLIFLLFCWEITTLMLFLLINQSGPQARTGAAKTLAMLGFSDCALLLGIGLIITRPDMSSPAIDQIHLSTNTPLMAICYLLFMIAGLAKAGAMPFHTWIPTAAEATTCDVMALLPAALDKLLGIYLLARASLELFVLTDGLKMLLMIIGAVTIIGAVMMAMVQHDLKKLLSFHAVSQVGYMVLGIGTGSVLGIAGGLFHMFNNAIYKSCLFLTAGAVEKQAGTTHLDRLGGLARTMPLTFTACLLAALAISGVPPMNGFSSKWMIYQAVLDVPSRWAPILTAAAIFGSALTLASFVKVLHSVFLSVPAPDQAPAVEGEVSGWMTVPMLALGVTCIVFGIWVALPLGALIIPSMTSMGQAGTDTILQANQIDAAARLWNPGLATLLLLGGLLMGLIIYFLGKGFKVRRTRTYIGGEKITPELVHYNGTGFYTTLRNLPGIHALYRDAERQVFDIYHLTGRLGHTLVEGLRRTQTGILSLYISWVILGLVVILICFIKLHSG